MAAEDRHSLQIISEESSKFILPVDASNKAFNPNPAIYSEKFKLHALALSHSQLSESMTISASVPLELVAEATQSFKKYSDTEFDFKMNGKTVRVHKAKFCQWLKIPVYDEYDPVYQKELYDCVNQIGHEPTIHASGDFLASHIPDDWLLLYHVACNLCGKCTGSGKINIPQLTVLYALYSDLKIDVGSVIFEQFCVINERRLPRIFFHRFWSVIVSESLKAFTDYVQKEDAQLMAIMIMPAPGNKKSNIAFSHIGQIPYAMLQNIPKENPLLIAHNQKHQVFIRRQYDMTLVNLADKGGKKGTKRKVPEASASKPVPTQKKAKKKKKEEKKKTPSPKHTPTPPETESEGSKNTNNEEEYDSEKTEERQSPPRKSPPRKSPPRKSPTPPPPPPLPPPPPPPPPPPHPPPPLPPPLGVSKKTETE